MMSPKNPNNRDRNYIGREEFEVFERSVDQSFSRLADAITTLTNKVDRMSSTDWRTFGMFAALILSIVTLAASPFLRDLDRLGRNQEVLREKVEMNVGDRWTEDDHREYDQHIRDEFGKLRAELHAHTSNGHPFTVLSRVERLEREGSELDARVRAAETLGAKLESNSGQ
jgi:hypothetical protein